ncbi:hypothetical protein KIPB_002739, partial [Kipferlia bialata]
GIGGYISLVFGACGAIQEEVGVWGYDSVRDLWGSQGKLEQTPTDSCGESYFERYGSCMLNSDTVLVVADCGVDGDDGDTFLLTVDREGVRETCTETAPRGRGRMGF